MIGELGKLGQLGRFNVKSGDIIVTPVTFTVTAGQTVTIALAVKAGTTAVINWGEGTTSSVTNSGDYQNYTKTYASGGTYTGSISNVGVITHFRMLNETKANFAFTLFRALTYLFLNGTGSAVTGVITNMELTNLFLSGTGSAVTGVITNMALTYLFLNGTGSAVTGAITNMALTYLVLYNTGSAVTGTLKSTSRLTREFINITGEITLPTNRVYGTWGADAMRIDMDAHKLTAEETDATLIRLAASPISGANKTYYIYGASPTAASDAAHDILGAAGVVGVITG